MSPTSRPQPLLVAPAYGYARSDGAPYHPTVRQAFAEWLDAMNVWRDRTRLVAFVTGSFHILAGIAAVVYSTWYLTWESIPSRIVSTAIGLGFGVVYHSVWWHRYCTHKAFTFRSLFWARLFTWTNPLAYRDETFVIPHRIHHQTADRPGDPYTPLAGWLVCYLSAETAQRMNTQLTRAQYERLVSGLRHIGLRTNSYEDFQRTGSVEHVGTFLFKAALAQVLWVAPFAIFGGTMWVLSLYSAVFWSMFILRDFNYRGHTHEPDHAHEAGWDFGEGLAINHRLYGYMIGEWHNNHHACPSSARMGFLRGQLDLGFLFIKFLHRVGIVTSYTDQREHFHDAYVARARQALSG
jgi:sn-1 stearoyl-lipid 9-desaturase